MGKSKPIMIPKYKYDTLVKKIGSLTGYNKTVESFQIRLKKLEIENRMLKNEIKAIKLRHERLRQRFRNNRIYNGH